MSQSVVTIRLNGHPYQIGCEVGEEGHVAELGKEVESVLQSLVKSAGQIGEARLLAMVALILADRAASPVIGRPDNSNGHVPLLIFKRNRTKTYAVLEFNKLLELLDESK